jgi:hypothetical protein
MCCKQMYDIKSDVFVITDVVRQRQNGRVQKVLNFFKQQARHVSLIVRHYLRCTIACFSKEFALTKSIVEP